MVPYAHRPEVGFEDEGPAVGIFAGNYFEAIAWSNDGIAQRLDRDGVFQRVRTCRMGGCGCRRCSRSFWRSRRVGIETRDSQDASKECGYMERISSFHKIDGRAVRYLLSFRFSHTGSRDGSCRCRARLFRECRPCSGCSTGRCRETSPRASPSSPRRARRGPRSWRGQAGCA
jgi:hypothetical protein